VCIKQEGRLEILPLRVSFDKPPVGRRHVQVLSERIPKQFAADVLAWIEKLERVQRLKVRRIAIDAPSDYCRPGSKRRAAEQSLAEDRINCIATPSEAQFRSKILACRRFLAHDGKANRLPNANQLWMLVGFELFRTLKGRYECIETYPQAVVHQLKCAAHHKSTKRGLQRQIVAAAQVLGVSATEIRARLQTMGYGSTHDRLDAFLSAWVASLDDRDRKAFGTPPDDAIWVPRC